MKTGLPIGVEIHSQRAGNPLALTGGIPRSRSFTNAAGKILYAEDDPAVREVTTLVLARAGYTVLAVSDGAAAWDAIEAGGFDLLVTDNDMPRLTGLELVARIRQNSIPVPVILASGSAGFFSGDEYSWLGFAACLQKPVAPHQLLVTIQRVLEENAVPA